MVPESNVHAAADRPVFVSEDGRRARRLALGTQTLALLVAAWAIALAAGSVGFTRLPPIRSQAATQPGPVAAFASRTRAARAQYGSRVGVAWHRGAPASHRARDCDGPRHAAAPGASCHSVTA